MEAEVPHYLDEDEILHLHHKDNQLWVQEGNGAESACESLGGLAFRCNLGFFEMETVAPGSTPILVWGKATRYRQI